MSTSAPEPAQSAPPPPARNYPFAGVYRSFSEVPQAASFGHSKMWEEQQRYVANLSRTEFGPAGLRKLIRSKALLTTTVAFLAQRTKPIRILDFGGGAGQDFGNLLASGALTELTYHVVDMDPICAIGRDVWADDPRITFSPELPQGGQFDLVYAFSAIQYVEDTATLLRQFTDFGPKAILLMAHPLADKSFVRAQINMDVPVPNLVLDLPVMISTLAACGYDLALRAWSETDLNVENFDPNHRVGGDANLLFLKNGS